MNVNVAREKRDPGSRRAVSGEGVVGKGRERIWWGRRETGTVGEGEKGVLMSWLRSGGRCCRFLGRHRSEME